MATYSISAPDGNTYSIEGPEGASQKAVENEVLRQNPSAGTAAKAAPTAQAAPAAPAQRSFLGEIGRQVGLTGRAAANAVAGIPLAVADFSTGLTNLVTGDNSRQMPSRLFDQGLTRLGLPQAEGGLERAVQAGAGAVGGVGVSALAPRLFGAMAAPLASNLGTQAPVAAVSGMVAQPIAQTVSEATNSELAGTVAGTLAGAVTGGALSGAKNTAVSMARARNPTVTIPAAREISSNAYNAADREGVAIKPQPLLNMVDRMRTQVRDAGLIEGSALTQPLEALFTSYDKTIGTTRVSFGDLEQMRRQASLLTKSPDASMRGFANVVLNEMDGQINKLTSREIVAGATGLDKAVALTRSARDGWRIQAKAQTLEDVLDTTNLKMLDPGANEGQLIRKQLISLAGDKAKFNKFNPEERAEILRVAKGGSSDALLTFAAKLNPQRGLGAAGASGALGFAAASPTTAAAMMAGGFAADKLQGALRASATKNLIQDVLSNNIAPRGQGMGFRGALAGNAAVAQDFTNPNTGGYFPPEDGGASPEASVETVAPRQSIVEQGMGSHTVSKPNKQLLEEAIMRMKQADPSLNVDYVRASFFKAPKAKQDQLLAQLNN